MSVPPPGAASAVTLPPLLARRPGGRSRGRARSRGARAPRRRGRSGRRCAAGPRRRCRARGRARSARRSCRRTSTGSPAGLYLTALSIRLPTARSSRAGTPGDERRLQLRLERRRGRVPARALDDLADEQVQAQLLGVGARFLAAGEVDQVVDQQRQLLDLLDDVAEQPLAVPRGPCPGPAAAGSRCWCAGW